jgi:hypothetical protein
MEKIDLQKTYKNLYIPSAKAVQLVEVPAFNFAMIDGAIEPGQMPGTSPAFQEATQALYGVSYTLKFAAKQRKENPIEYGVMALEGLWGLKEGEFDINKKDNWTFRLMIMQPDFITQAMFQDALRQAKRKRDSAALDKLRLERFEEGLCVQIMHIGPYATEPATVAKMDAFAAQNGYRMAGLHHEIYIGNPLRADPEKLKTVMRHGVEAVGFQVSGLSKTLSDL